MRLAAPCTKAYTLKKISRTSGTVVRYANHCSTEAVSSLPLIFYKVKYDLFIRPCSEELNFLRVTQRGAPEVLGSSDSRSQIFQHALLARLNGFC